MTTPQPYPSPPSEEEASLHALEAQGVDATRYLRAAACPQPLQINAERNRRSYRRFIQEAWHTVEPGVFVGNWHIDAIADALQAVKEGHIKRLLINEPPRCMKSLGVSVFFGPWCWIDQPELRLMYASFVDDLSLRDSQRAREVIQSRWYQARWGHMFALVGDQNTKGRFRNSAGGERVAVSTGGKGLGEGADILVADDPQNVRRMDSKDYRTETKNWWRRTWSQRLNDRKTGRKILVMQRLHEDDISGHVLAKEHGWEHLMLPMEFEPERKCVIWLRPPSPGCPEGKKFEDPRTQEKELLWPERIGPEELEEIESEIEAYDKAGQLQQRPTSPGGRIIQRSWMELLWDTLPAEITTGLISIDMNFGDVDEKNLDPDYVRMGAIALVGKADYMLIDGEGDTWEYSEAKVHIKAFVERMRKIHPRLVRRVVVEKKANGAALISDLRKIIPGVVGFEPSKYGSKAARLRAVAGIFQAGNFWLPKKWRDLEEFRGQLADFPKARHDDYVDMASQGLLTLREEVIEPFFIRRVGA